MAGRLQGRLVLPGWVVAVPAPCRARSSRASSLSLTTSRALEHQHVSRAGDIDELRRRDRSGNGRRMARRREPDPRFRT